MINKGFDVEFKDKLKEANDIVSVVSKYCTVTKKGKNYWTCCPFHHEKTPSFSINEVEQYYHCFGCGEKGDVFSFVSKMEGVDFVGAMKILCKNCGMEMPTFEVDENAKKLKEKKDQILNANREAARYFNANLSSNEAKIARDYLDGRKISQNSISRFGIGYSKDWNGLVNHLKSKKIPVEVMKEAGLINIKDGHPYDIMAGRLMFPLINAVGDVVGFSARILTQEKFAKYRNTEQTLVFDKSKVIYGINLIKKQFQQKGVDYVLLVEGQIDVISLHQAGFTTVVATLGTALTSQHAKELSRYSSNIIVCFDGDGAGQKATLRSLDILKDSFYIRVATIPNGQDPDEYIKANGAESFQKILNEAKPLNDFKIYSLAKNYDLTNNYEKKQFVEEGLKIIREIPSQSEKEIYINLLSDIAKVSKDNLTRDLYASPKESDKTKTDKEKETKEQNVEELPNAYVESARFVISSLLFKKDYAYYFKGVSFKNSSLQKLYDEMVKHKKEGKPFIVSNVFDMFDVETDSEINNILSLKLSLVGLQAKIYYDGCLRTLKNAMIDEEIAKLTKEYEECPNVAEKTQIAVKIQQKRQEKMKKVEEL